MAALENQSSWDIIQQGVRDTERLIGQKKYNLSMVKARQTLEYMVKLLGEKACIIDGDLIDIIDTLYQGRWITKSTCEHYHKIRMIGNKAVHEGSDNAYDANQAYHLLSQEVYTFANEYSGKRKANPRTSSSSGSRSASAKSGSTFRQGSGSSSGTRSGSRPSSSSAATRSRKKAKSKGMMITPYDLLKLLIPVLCIILLVVLIKFIRPSSDKQPETTSPTTTTETVPETDPPTETLPDETAPPVVYKTTTSVNIRPEPNTNNTRIALLAAGTAVEVVEQYNEEWTKINYNGQEAYISSQFITTE